MRVFCGVLIATFLASCSASVWSQNIKLVRPDDVISRANALYDSGKYAETIALLKTIPERDTAYAQILSKFAYTYVDAKDFDKAIEVCREALKMPSAERAVFLKIQALATNKKGDYKQAIVLFESAIKEYPTDVSLIFNLGLIQYNNKDYEKAETNFFKVLSINPFHPASHLNLARLGIGQGRKVHAMLAMGIYLGVNDKDNSSLVQINSFLDNQVTDEGTFPTFGANAPAKLDQMIRARIVNEEGFKSIFPVKAAAIQQFELLFDQLNSIPPAADDRYTNFYLPVYKAIKENKGLEAFVYHLLSSSAIEAATKWRNKNDKELKAFYDVTNTALKKNRENLIVEQLGFNELVNAWYNSSNQLTALGNLKNDKRQGKWIFLHTNSEKSADGAYNDLGAKVGTWKYFHKNGNVKSIENYATGEITVYSEKGNKAEHFFLKNDAIEGDVELFYESGPINEKLKFAAGKKHGNRVIYFGDGTVKASYQYKNGQPDGDYFLNYENGKISERCSYKNDMLDGKYESFHINGVLAIIGNYANGYQAGQWKHYYSNRKLQRTGTYNEKGLPVGEWTYYDPGGLLTEKRNFDIEGRYHGDITYYDDGKVYCISSYKKDVIIKDTFYDVNGNVLNTSGGNEGTFYSKNYFSTGELRSEGNYKKGKMEGQWKFYNRFGRFISEFFYKDNSTDGPAKEYFSSGEVKIESEYQDGKLHGYYREYYRNGKVKREGWYQDGNREQQWLAYYQDGMIESDFYYLANESIGKGYEFTLDGKKFIETEIDDGGNISGLQYFNSQGAQSTVKRNENFRDIYEEFYKNGKPKSRSDVLCGTYSRMLERYFPDGTLHYQIEMVNGKKNGKYVYYEMSGKVSSTGLYANDLQTGVWKTYHDNGKLYSEGHYLDDERDSLWTYYHDNGNVSSKALFKDDKRNGVTTYYAPDGTALVEKLFKQGDFIAYRPVINGSDAKWTPFSGNGKIEISYANGSKAFAEEYKNGLPHGYDRLYYPDGKLFSEYQYDNGDLTGEYKAYHPNGKLKASGSFQDDERNGKFERYAEDGTTVSMETYKMGNHHGKSVLYNKGVKQKEFNFWNRVTED